MKTIERLYKYFDYKGIKPTRLEKELSISNGYFNTQYKRKADIGSGIVQLIVDHCQDLNITWLITGRESMINLSPEELSNINKEDCIKCKEKEHLINLLEQTLESQKKLINELGKQLSKK